MIELGTKVSRGLSCLLAACAGAALAAPTGPLVHAGKASYDAATLTVTSATLRTQIGWQSFNLAAGEVVTFIQPSAQSAVLNQVFDAHSLNILGGLHSNGSVYFMANGRVSGAGVNLDLTGALSTSLRLPPLTTASSGGAALDQAMPLTTLDEGGIYVFGRDEQAVTTANGEAVLNPGKTVELAHASTLRLRVELTAPEAEAINLSRLVAGKHATGIYAGLFRVPAAARQAGRHDADAVMTASARAPGTPEIERFVRYALLYAQMRRGMEEPEGGLMQVAAVSNSRILLPAAKSRPSLLPRDIEIGASERLPERDTELLLALAPAEPPAEMTATLAPQAIAAVAKRAAERDTELLLALAPAEPPAEMTATLAPQAIVAVAKRAPQRDTELLLALAPAEPPAEMTATPAPQAIAAVAKRAPALIVVALADGAHPVPVAREEPKPKEVLIERRAPRYFTDHRGAMFFM